MIEVKVPVLAESIPDAMVLEWRKRAGETVEKDEILVELETDKVALEVLAPEAGVIKEIIKGDGETVLSDEVMATIDPAGAAAEPKGAEPTETADAEPEETSPELSPAVRKLVSEHNLDGSHITGTGRGGRLVKGDVLAFIDNQSKAEPAKPEPTPPPPAPSAPPTRPALTGGRSERREPMSRLRQRVAERLVQAQQSAAILTTFNEMNMQPVMELRSRYKERFEKEHGVRLGFMSFFAKASVIALQKFPAVNAYIEGTDVLYHDYYDIGIAVGSPRGLVVPILRDVDQMSFADIEGSINDFASRAQSGRLRLDELTGGTFTISNGGVFGSLLSTPILNPPQSGILGMHKTQERPMAENGQVVIRPMMYLALSYDHRVIDGREAVQFLIAIKEALEDPGRMLLGV